MSNDQIDDELLIEIGLDFLEWMKNYRSKNGTVVYEELRIQLFCRLLAAQITVTPDQDLTMERIKYVFENLTANINYFMKINRESTNTDLYNLDTSKPAH